MNIETINIKDLKPYGKNIKKHDKKQISKIAMSIREYGEVICKRWEKLTNQKRKKTTP